MNKINQIKNSALNEISEAGNAVNLEKLRVKYLGRKGELTSVLRGLKDLPTAERVKTGEEANKVKREIELRIANCELRIKDLESGKIKREEFIDITQPGINPPEGHFHLTSLAIREIEEVFKKIGFTRRRYPEVESDWYAFESLNMPPNHPARDEWETFFLSKDVVLTPHTSSGQAREMEKGKLPIRIINISRCYRRQADVSHVPMFHQFEGLCIDKKVSIVHLKGVLDYFARQFFGPQRKTRLRPFHFRFTEPSFEIDISCDVCGGKGKLADGSKCRLCKEGWLELGGAGMVHPNVLRAGKIDPRKYSGFAFGWGVERTFMMKSGLRIDDIRVLYQNDLRFLEQF